MRVLVTGASGYIGAVMTPYLAAAGHDVATFDLGLYESGSFSEGVPRPDRRDIRTASLADVSARSFTSLRFPMIPWAI